MIRALTLIAAALIFVLPLNQGVALAQSDALYVRIADLAQRAPVVARVKVKSSIPLKPERAPGLAPGQARLYVEAEVLNLIRGSSGISESIRYLVDVPLQRNGKAPKLKKQEFLVFATQQGVRPGEIQLVGPGAHMAWTPEADDLARTILSAMLAADAPPVVTGVREALYVPGTLRGEGETQIFLKTQNGDPVSLSVLRRPGLQPQWAVSLTEIVDSAASKPRRGTLLWYRLACSLPDKLPRAAMLNSDEDSIAAAGRDYDFVLSELGGCPR